MGLVRSFAAGFPAIRLNDFRIGVACRVAGSLIWLPEINTYLLANKTDGQKSMKDVFQYLYQWAQTSKRPFAVDEFPKLVMQATGCQHRYYLRKMAAAPK